METVSILGVCMVASVIALLLKQYKGEYAFAVAAAAGAAVFISLLFTLSDGLLRLRNIISAYGADTTYFSVVLKALGICVVTGFAADTCRDAGQTALASRAELAGRCAVFVMSVPLLEALLETVYGFLE